MQKLSRQRWLAILVMIVLILSSTSCSRLLGQNKEQSQNEQQQNKDPPSALTEMEKETNNMIQQIQKVRDQRAQMIRQQMSASQKENGGNKSQQEQQKSNQGEQKQRQQKQGQQKQQKNQNQDVQQTQLTINWQDFEKKIKAINELWNNYEPQAKKDGAPDMLVSQFEEQLNTLTNAIMARNEDETLVAANGLYQYYPQFFNLYRHKAPPEIKEIKYYLQEILINAEAGKWEDAAALLENMEKAWQTAKSRM